MYKPSPNLLIDVKLKMTIVLILEKLGAKKQQIFYLFKRPLICYGGHWISLFSENYMSLLKNIIS